MLDILNSALRGNDYYICLYKNNIYIYNYEEIINFNSDYILVKISNLNIKIKGSNLHILKMENHELLIRGLINGVWYE